MRPSDTNEDEETGSLSNHLSWKDYISILYAISHTTALPFLLVLLTLILLLIISLAI